MHLRSRKKLFAQQIIISNIKKLTNEVRFDVIGIVKSGNRVVKSYVKGAFSEIG